MTSQFIFKYISGSKAITRIMILLSWWLLWKTCCYIHIHLSQQLKKVCSGDKKCRSETAITVLEERGSTLKEVWEEMLCRKAVSQRSAVHIAALHATPEIALGSGQ